MAVSELSMSSTGPWGICSTRLAAQPTGAWSAGPPGGGGVTSGPVSGVPARRAGRGRVASHRPLEGQLPSCDRLFGPCPAGDGDTRTAAAHPVSAAMRSMKRATSCGTS